MSLRVRVTCLRLGGASPTLGTSLFDTCAPWGLGARPPRNLLAIFRLRLGRTPVRLEKPAVHNSPRAALT